MTVVRSTVQFEDLLEPFLSALEDDTGFEGITRRLRADDEFTSRIEIGRLGDGRGWFLILEDMFHAPIIITTDGTTKSTQIMYAFCEERSFREALIATLLRWRESDEAYLKERAKGVK